MTGFTSTHPPPLTAASPAAKIERQTLPPIPFIRPSTTPSNRPLIGNE